MQRCQIYCGNKPRLSRNLLLKVTFYAYPQYLGFRLNYLSFEMGLVTQNSSIIIKFLCLAICKVNLTVCGAILCYNCY